MRDELNPEQSSPWHAFASAVQFLTRIPVPGGMNRLGADASLLRSAVVFFPLVGGLVGGVTGSIIFGASQVWSPFVAVIIALVIEAMITGAFHEDAVADCCDGFGGGWTRADILRIMSDSRIGSFGALGLMLAVLARLSFVASVPTNEVLPAMIAAGAIGRWSSILVMAIVPPVVREGLAKDVGNQIGLRELLFGTLLTIPALAWYATLEPLRCAVAVGAVILPTLIWARYVRIKLGGFTGDCLGFICYVSQIALSAVASARWT